MFEQRQIHGKTPSGLHTNELYFVILMHAQGAEELECIPFTQVGEQYEY